jgi:hypothetical protein
MHAADSAFAWLHSSPLRVALPTSPDVLESLHSSRLLRHAPVCVVIVPPPGYDPFAEFAREDSLDDSFWRDFDRLVTKFESRSGSCGGGI